MRFIDSYRLTVDGKIEGYADGITGFECDSVAKAYHDCISYDADLINADGGEIDYIAKDTIYYKQDGHDYEERIMIYDAETDEQLPFETYRPYYVVEVRDDEWTLCITEDKAEAIREAREAWERLTKSEREKTEIEIRRYVSDIGLEWVDNYDADLIEWRYLVNYHTGAGFWHCPTIEVAKMMGDRGASYTGMDITIDDPIDWSTVATRRWWSTMDGCDDCEDPIIFGTEGYYGDWE